MKYAIGFFTVLFLLANATLASTPTRSANFSSNSPNAVIILKAPVLPEKYKLNISQFDISTKSLLSLSIDISIDRKSNHDGFFVKMVAPGNYLVKSISQQKFWLNCFSDDTIYFSISPGEVLYLGNFDGVNALNDLYKNVKSRGAYVSYNRNRYHFFEGVPRPLFTFTNGDYINDMVELNAMLAKKFPSLTGLPKITMFKQTSFLIDKSTSASDRLCSL